MGLFVKIAQEVHRPLLFTVILTNNAVQESIANTPRGPPDGGKSRDHPHPMLGYNQASLGLDLGVKLP